MKAEPCQEAGRIQDLMTPHPVSVPPTATLAEVAETMTERRFRHMPVVDPDGRLLGIVSRSDLLAVGGALQDLEGGRGSSPVSEVMHTGIDTVRPEGCAAEAARHMLRTKRSCLPVVHEDGRLLGILTEADYLRLATRDAPPCSCGAVRRGAR